MGKLEGMDSNDRERLWPQLVQGFKDLSNRLKVLICAFDTLKYLYELNISYFLVGNYKRLIRRVRSVNRSVINNVANTLILVW